MGHNHSTVGSSSKRHPPHRDSGPDRNATLKSNKKNSRKIVQVFEEEQCTYKRMRCPNSPESELLPPPSNISVSFAPASPLSSSDESSHFVPGSPFHDSYPLADVSFSPLPPRPTRKLAAAPFKDLNRRRPFLVHVTEDSVVPTKKKRKFTEVFKQDPKNVIYDSTPSGTPSGKEHSEWKTPEPIATSTPIDWTTGPPKMHYTCAPSFPRVTSHTLVEKNPFRSIHRVPALPPSATTRATSHQTTSVERGFQSRALPRPTVQHYPVKMMPEPQKMFHRPPPIPQHKQFPKKPSNTGGANKQPLAAPSSSYNFRPLFTRLADPGPLRSPVPKTAVSKRPVYPQMGLTPRRVKQRRTMYGLGVTEKMYGCIDVPKRAMPGVPILTHPKDVSDYANTRSLLSPMRPNSALPPMPRTPMYNPPPAGYSFTPTSTPVRFSRLRTAIRLPSYAQMYPAEEEAHESLPSPSHYKNFTRFGRFV